MIGQIISVYFLICTFTPICLNLDVQISIRLCSPFSGRGQDGLKISVPRNGRDFCLNSLVGFIVLISFIFALPNVNDALNSPTGFAFVYTVQQVTYKGVIPLIVIILALLILVMAN